MKKLVIMALIIATTIVAVQAKEKVEKPFMSAEEFGHELEKIMTEEGGKENE